MKEEPEEYPSNFGQRLTPEQFDERLDKDLEEDHKFLHGLFKRLAPSGGKVRRGKLIKAIQQSGLTESRPNLKAFIHTLSILEKAQLAEFRILKSPRGSTVVQTASSPKSSLHSSSVPLSDPPPTSACLPTSASSSSPQLSPSPPHKAFKNRSSVVPDLVHYNRHDLQLSWQATEYELFKIRQRKHYESICVRPAPVPDHWCVDPEGLSNYVARQGEIRKFRYRKRARVDINRVAISFTTRVFESAIEAIVLWATTDSDATGISARYGITKDEFRRRAGLKPIADSELEVHKLKEELLRLTTGHLGILQKKGKLVNSKSSLPALSPKR